MNLTSLYNDFISDIKICILYNVGQSKKKVLSPSSRIKTDVSFVLRNGTFAATKFSLWNVSRCLMNCFMVRMPTELWKK